MTNLPRSENNVTRKAQPFPFEAQESAVENLSRALAVEILRRGELLTSQLYADFVSITRELLMACKLPTQPTLELLTALLQVWQQNPAIRTPDSELMDYVLPAKAQDRAAKIDHLQYLRRVITEAQKKGAHPLLEFTPGHGEKRDGVSVAVPTEYRLNRFLDCFNAVVLLRAEVPDIRTAARQVIQETFGAVHRKNDAGRRPLKDVSARKSASTGIAYLRKAATKPPPEKESEKKDSDLRQILGELLDRNPDVGQYLCLKPVSIVEEGDTFLENLNEAAAELDDPEAVAEFVQIADSWQRLRDRCQRRTDEIFEPASPFAATQGVLRNITTTPPPSDPKTAQKTTPEPCPETLPETPPEMAEEGVTTLLKGGSGNDSSPLPAGEVVSSSLRLCCANFKKASDVQAKPGEVTIEEIVKQLSSPVVRKEKDGTGFSFARFRDNYRRDQNVTEVAALGFDCDGKVSIDEAVDTLTRTRLKWVLYTTHSHQRVTETHPKPVDCFRCFIFLEEPIPAEAYERVWVNVEKRLFQGRSDPAVKNPSRLWYKPAIATPDAEFYFASQITDESAFLDWKPFNVEERKPKSQPVKLNGNADAYVRAAVEGELHKLEQAEKGERNHQLFKSSASIARFVGKINEGEVRGQLESVALSIGLGSREIKKTIDSGFERGKQASDVSMVGK